MSSQVLFSIASLAVGAVAMVLGYRMWLVVETHRSKLEPADLQGGESRGGSYAPAYVLMGASLLIISITLLQGRWTTATDKELMRLFEEANKSQSAVDYQKVQMHLLSEHRDSLASLGYLAGWKAHEAASRQEIEDLEMRLSALMSLDTNVNRIVDDLRKADEGTLIRIRWPRVDLKVGKP